MLFDTVEAQASAIIKKYEKHYAELPDAELATIFRQLKHQLVSLQTSPHTLEEQTLKVLPQVFGLVREAAFRELGYRHHKEQLMAGIALYKGYLAQMQTGEGKTLAITAPAYLAALSGGGVHIVTANDYLARRDCANMGGIYTRLGVSCAVITANGQFLFFSAGRSSPQLRPCTRQEAYRAGITYGTASAFGFDYLRDQLVYEAKDLVQRPQRTFAILDEADNILLDEARTPLIISGKSKCDTSFYNRAIELVRQLLPQQDYIINKTARTVTFTEQGINKLENWLALDDKNNSSLFDGVRSELFYLDNSLKALTLYHNGEDYFIKSSSTYPNKTVFSDLVNATYPIKSFNKKTIATGQNQQEGEVVLIDQLTGRPMPLRRLGGGLHEALEAKEGLSVKSPTTTQATISLHAYFRGYKKLAGVSGTIETDKATFYRLYGLATLVVATHHPVQRIEAAPLVYGTEAKTIQALIEAAIKVRESGGPVLIGTPSVAVSEVVSARLATRKVPHQLLNARQNAEEARLIARAGFPGRITVATNMAGRGTDILLGGSYEEHLVDLANQQGLVKEADEGSPAWQKLAQEARTRHHRAKEIVYRAGGLHVLGLGLQSSRRLDRQLIGRAGRQGDPGYSQFFYSLEDKLVVHCAGDSLAYRRLMSGVPQSYKALKSGENSLPKSALQKLETPLALRLVQECQHKAEGQHLDMLTQGIEFDSVLNRQRDLFYSERQRFLQADNEELKAEILKLACRCQETLGEKVVAQFKKSYQNAELQPGSASLVSLVRKVVLETLDNAWAQYLTPLEDLRQGMGLRVYGGQKPLQAYQLEAYKLWKIFQENTSHELIRAVFIHLTQLRTE